MRARRVVKDNTPVFVTQVTWNREPLFASRENVTLLRGVLHRCKERHPFRMIAYVFLPDHVHLLVAPQNEVTISLIMAAMKAAYSIEFRKSHALPGRTNLWQKGFWDHIVRDDEDLRRHIDYIHYNPVRHGLAERPEAWPDSSFAWWKSTGHYEDGWGWSQTNDAWLPGAPSWSQGME